MNIDRLQNKCRRILQENGDLEDILSYLRDEGCDKIDSMRVIRNLTDFNGLQCKIIVSFSRAWRDRKEADDAFHEQLIKSFSEEKVECEVEEKEETRRQIRDAFRAIGIDYDQQTYK